MFSIIKNLKANGTAVLYVTHRLEEIMALTDRVTVLRNGELVSTCDTGSTSQKELVRLMSGNEKENGSAVNILASATANIHSGTPALTISHLSSADHIVKDASITVHHRTHHRNVRSLRQRADGIFRMHLRHPAHIRRDH